MDVEGGGSMLIQVAGNLPAFHMVSLCKNDYYQHGITMKALN
jgi:hypothetical protein